MASKTVYTIMLKGLVVSRTDERQTDRRGHAESAKQSTLKVLDQQGDQRVFEVRICTA